MSISWACSLLKPVEVVDPNIQQKVCYPFCFMFVSKCSQSLQKLLSHCILLIPYPFRMCDHLRQLSRTDQIFNYHFQSQARKILATTTDVGVALENLSTSGVEMEKESITQTVRPPVPKPISNFKPTRTHIGSLFHSCRFH